MMFLYNAYTLPSEVYHDKKKAGTVIRSGRKNSEKMELSNTLTGYVCLQIIEELRCGDSRQPSRNNLQRVGDCQSSTFLTVVDG